MNRNYLYLGIGTFILGPLCIIALFLARNEYQVSEARGVVYTLMVIVGAFIFMFGYIPLSLYRDERRGTK